jgi:hypothetical protein
LAKFFERLFNRPQGVLKGSVTLAQFGPQVASLFGGQLTGDQLRKSYQHLL